MINQIWDDNEKKQDLGCGEGEYLLKVSQIFKQRNHLGVELRGINVETCLRNYVKYINQFFSTERKSSFQNNEKNLHYTMGSSSITLEDLKEIIIEEGVNVSHISILFPDPWFKSSQKKRLMITPELLNLIYSILSPGGELLIKTDVKDVYDYTLSLIHDLENQFSEGLFDANSVFSIPTIHTLRESTILSRDLPIYSTVFHKPLEKY